MGMDKNTAKTRVCALKTPYGNRAEALIDDPDKLSQADHGVCGMTAVVHGLLHHKLEKIVELLGAIFAGSPFPVKGRADVRSPQKTYRPLPTWSQYRTLPEEDRTELLGGRLKQYHVGKTRGPGELDFIMARSLGKLLKTVEPSLYRSQIAFSEQLVQHFSEKDSEARNTLKKNAANAADEMFRKEGDLGLTPDGLRWILTHLAGVDDVMSFERDRHWSILRVNDAFGAPRPDRHAVVYAFVLDATRFEDASRLPQGTEPAPFDTFTPTTRPVTAEHIIVITGRIIEEDGRYVVPVWTWSKRFTVRVRKDLFDQFFTTILYGFM
jgi:hypothetical protein